MPTFLPTSFVFNSAKIMKSDPGLSANNYCYLLIATLIFFGVVGLIARRWYYNAAMRKQKAQSHANKAVSAATRTPKKRPKYLPGQKHLPLALAIAATILVGLTLAIFENQQKNQAILNGPYPLMAQSNLVTKPGKRKYQTIFNSWYGPYRINEVTAKKPLNYYIYVKQNKHLTYLGNVKNGYLFDYQNNQVSRAFGKLNRYINEQDLEDLFQKQLKFNYSPTITTLTSNKAKLQLITNKQQKAKIKLNIK